MRLVCAAPCFGLVLVAACHRMSKHYVERVEVSGTTVVDNGVLGLTSDQVERDLRVALQSRPEFVLLDDEARPAEGLAPVRLSLDLAFTREAQKDGRAGTLAEVGATLTVSVRERGAWARYDVVGLSDVPEAGESTPARREALRRALRGAIDQAVGSAHLQLVALAKPDSELLRDLASKDGRVREFALRTLSDRGNPAVADALLAKLQGDDVDEIRRAIGGLVQLKERRAVPALIDLVRGKETGFLREVVFALGTIGGDDAAAYLFTVAQGHEEPEIRSAAEKALAELKVREDKGSRGGAKK